MGSHPHTIIFSGESLFFPRVKWSDSKSHRSPQSNARIKNQQELYLYASSMLLWFAKGQLYLYLYPKVLYINRPWKIRTSLRYVATDVRNWRLWEFPSSCRGVMVVTNGLPSLRVRVGRIDRKVATEMSEEHAVSIFSVQVAFDYSEHAYWGKKLLQNVGKCSSFSVNAGDIYRNRCPLSV